MRAKRARSLPVFAAWALAFAGAATTSACSNGAPRDGGRASAPPATAVEAPRGSATANPLLSCGLKAPVKGEDPCSTDTDCGPDRPCHAHACVAIAKAHPRRPTDICTEILDCRSTDVNRCGCFEGRCSMMPK